MESQCTLNPLLACAPDRPIPLGRRIRDAWAAWWQAFLTHRAHKQTLVALSELDEHVLRDIGAPGWALRESEALRQIEHNRHTHWLWT